MYFIKPVEELRFTDDFMFSYVMRNKDICREVIRRLLKIEATDKFLRRLDMTVDKIKEVQEFVNSYLAYNLHEYDVQERGRIEGAAMQKAKDERLINQQAEEIARLKALLAEKNTHP